VLLRYQQHIFVTVIPMFYRSRYRLLADTPYVHCSAAQWEDRV